MPNCTHLFTRKALLLVLFALLLLPHWAFRSDAPEWTEVELNNTLTVRFPGRPSFQTVQDIPLYTVSTEEAVYKAMVIDDKWNPRYRPIPDEHAQYKVYLGFMDSVLRNFKSTLTDSTSFHLGPHRGMDFHYTATAEDGAALTRHCRVIMLDDFVYTLSVTPVVLPTDESRSTEKLFMESLQPKKQ